jgi:hypothetical protein
MKRLAAVFLIAVIAIGLPSFASAEDPEAKSCTATSTSGKCLLREIAALKGQITTLQGQVTTLQGQLAGTSTSTLDTDIETLQSTVNSTKAQNAIALGQYVSVNTGTLNGLAGPHIIFSGVNVHIESGSGNTVDSTGLGNLVIGYDEDSNDPLAIDADRTGSHNLVIGSQHEFTASGGVVSGYANFTSANYATVSGGDNNAASGYGSSVSGGYNNMASGEESSILGGDGVTLSTMYGTSP